MGNRRKHKHLLSIIGQKDSINGLYKSFQILHAKNSLFADGLTSYLLILDCKTLEFM